MEYDIFLSYSHKDAEIMTRVRNAFQGAGLSAWIDEGIQPGTPSWRKAIETVIKESNCVVVIFTPNANLSHWVQEELDFAWMQRKPIFPILGYGEEKDSIPYGFAGYQVTDLRDEQHYSDRIRHLISTIRKTFAPRKINNYPKINDREIVGVQDAAKYLSEKFAEDIKPFMVTRWVQKGHFETIQKQEGSSKYYIFTDSLYLPPHKRINRKNRTRLNVEN